MTEWLIQHFVRDAQNTDNPTVRTRYGQFAGVVCIICNLVLCLSKGAIGLLSGSVSIVADAVNNLSDASSNIISLLGFKLASKPADPGHPYGHGRYEYLAGLIVAALVLAIGIELVKSSVEKILVPTPVEFSAALVVVLLLSICVKLWMAVFNRTVGRRIGSETLEATAVDSRNDVISTAAVLISAIVAQLTGLNLDGWVGAAVGFFILWSGFGLVREAVSPLLGEAPSSELVEHIRSKIMSYPGVLGTHDLMVHDYGPGRQFASAHVEMAAEADPMQSHDLIDNIEQDFKTEDHLIVTLHYDPIVTDDPEVADMRNWINQAVKIIDPRISIHDLRTVPGPTHTNVIFDCVRPTDLELDEAALARRIDQIVRDHYPNTRCVITVDESYVSSEQ
ncbi:cation diffusion facilitator family transporter [Collinsella intestinalis]|uniref:cation diffusion facilitator family transporter n=1 Tax=Collinsella intestinalis TaxID=147207 RepID=UPI001958AECA|nr:cation diffusion facilitator family transporter [Collinsella intestinalis]MBM6683340.1 cation transporter [Collinsella intestinalis]